MIKLPYSEWEKATEVGILGSCISRDFKLPIFPNAKSAILWRINTISLTNNKKWDSDIDVSYMEEHEQKSFLNDYTKKFDLNSFLSRKYVITDFFRDTYSIANLKNGNQITLGPEYSKYEMKNRLQIENIKNFFNEEYIDIWYDSIIKFSEIANNCEAEIIIIPAPSMHGYVVNQSYSNLKIDHGTEKLRNYYCYWMEQIASILIKKSILMPVLNAVIEADPLHEYGPAPTHYNSKRYYNILKKTTLANPNLIVNHNDLSTEQRREISDQLLEIAKLNRF